MEETDFSSIEEAIEWYKKASKQGDMYAQLKLASIYEAGIHIKKDYKKAYELYKTAQKTNNPCAMPYDYAFVQRARMCGVKDSELISLGIINENGEML